MERIKIGEGIVELRFDAKKGTAELRNAQGQVVKSVDTMKQKANEASTSIKEIGTVALSVFASSRILGAMKEMVMQTAAIGDEFAKTSKRVGVAVKDLSALSHAAKISGVNFAELSVGLRSLARNAYMASIGGKEQADAFRDLGVSVVGAGGKLKSANDLLLEVSDAMRGMDNETSRTALAMKVFGDSGAQLIPMLMEGGSGIQALKDDAYALGIVWDNPAAQNAEKFSDALNRMMAAGQGVKNDVFQPMLPQLTQLADGMRQTTVEARGFIDAITSAKLSQNFLVGLFATSDASSAATNIRTAWSGLLEVLERTAPAGSFGQILAKLMNAGERAQMNDAIAGMGKLPQDMKSPGAILAEMDGKAIADAALAPLWEGMTREAEAAAKAREELKKRNDEWKNTVDSFRAGHTGLMPDQAGPGRDLMTAPEELLGAGSQEFATKVQQATDLQAAYNAELQRESELRWEIGQQVKESTDATIAATQEKLEAQRMATMQNAATTVEGMGYIAEGMQAMGANAKAMFIFQQMLEISRMIINASAAWGQASGQAGIAGFAIGAGIFAKLMAMVAVIKGQKAPSEPKMKVPGAAEGGIIFRPSVIAVAEKRPEIVAPLDKFQQMTGGGGNNTLNVKIGDERGLLRYLAFELERTRKRELLSYGGM